MPEKIEKFPIEIAENSNYDFLIEKSGLYLIEIIASCKNWRQNWRSGLNDDDLAVKIDNIEFPKLNNKSGLLNGEAAWNGNNLKGAKKIEIFILKLEAGDHKINFIPDKNPLICSIDIKKIENNIIEYIPAENNKKAEDGNNRQWITITLSDLPLKNLYINAIAGGKSPDRDDIKLIIDGEIQNNLSNKSPKYKNWYWAGNLLAGQSQEFNKDLNLPANLHYIELWADKTPSLEKVVLNLEESEENDANPKEEKTKIQSYNQFHGINGKEDYDRFDKEIIEAVDYWNNFFASHEYSPKVLLDYNLVKAIIYRESRIGYEKGGEIDVMQVGDSDNPALATLRNEPGYKANEFVSKNTRKHLSYSFPEEWLPVKVETPKESIFWGTRWLYNKAQKQYGTSIGNTAPFVREWKTWKQAVIDYNGSPQKYEYQRLVWQIYKDGIDPEGNVLWKKAKEGFGLILSITIIAAILSGAITSYYITNELHEDRFSQKSQENIEIRNYSSCVTDYSNITEEKVRKVFLKNLEEYKKDQYYYGDIFNETLDECGKQCCWMKGVVNGYYNDLAENMRNNEQFLEAVKSFDFVYPKVGDIDNDGENEIVFITTDVLNNDFIVINIVDKSGDKFQLAEKKIEVYSANIELRDLTSDIVPEIILYYSYGRWGDRISVYQYNNYNLEEVFNNEEFIFPKYTFSDENKNGRSEIKIQGEQFGKNPVGSEFNAGSHTKTEEVYEYNHKQAGFQLAKQEYFGLSGALHDVINEIKQKGIGHRLFADWQEKNRQELDYFLEKINIDWPNSNPFSGILEASVENWENLNDEPDDDEVWIKTTRNRMMEETEVMIKNDVSPEIINAPGPVYKIFFKKESDDGKWRVEKMNIDVNF